MPVEIIFFIDIEKTLLHVTVVKRCVVKQNNFLLTFSVLCSQSLQINHVNFFSASVLKTWAGQMLHYRCTPQTLLVAQIKELRGQHYYHSPPFAELKQSSYPGLRYFCLLATKPKTSAKER
jgi:hypothetical protein